MDPDSPRLPPELERIIFEVAVQLHRPLAATLARVASRVKDWVEAELYRVAVLRDGSLQVPFIHQFPMKAGFALQTRPHRYSDARAILIWDPPSNQDAFMQHATQLEEVALWHPEPRDDDAEDVLTSFVYRLANVRKLSVMTRVALEPLLHTANNLPVFDTLTHLSVLVNSCGKSILLGLSSCRNLTHLAFSFDPALFSENDFVDIFEAHRCLQVLVLADGGFTPSDPTSPAVDPDVAALLYPGLPSHILQRIVRIALADFFNFDAWTDDVEGSQGIFGRADAIMRQRQDREVAASLATKNSDA
ncbi:uncharacterized protein SCHCODRAFT_02489027 [Schizophyllum commune H4-8]|nr:uncharacterized protein SCHCODRAFT_02489027 [Schizophyllum commune H4-8]KAI5898537.1 hypothetical protein SCHCODRAFT_02489027 [Schizophyllum commune H4-8]